MVSVAMATPDPQTMRAKEGAALPGSRRPQSVFFPVISSDTPDPGKGHENLDMHFFQVRIGKIVQVFSPGGQIIDLFQVRGGFIDDPDIGIGQRPAFHQGNIQCPGPS